MTDTYAIVDWNTGGQDPDHVRRQLLNQRENHRMTNLTAQEIDNNLFVTLAELGMLSHTTGWCVNAWDPNVWILIDALSLRLVDRPWVSGDGKRVLYPDFDAVLLCDKKGRTKWQLSGKLPPNIQDGEGPRVTLAVEALNALYTWASDQQADSIVVGIDANYDPNFGNNVPDLQRALVHSHAFRLLSPLTSTIGRDRVIDHFLLLRRVMNGSLDWRTDVEPWVSGKRGPNIHRLQARVLGWDK